MRRKASWGWGAAVGLAALIGFLAASSVNDIGGKNMMIFRVPAGEDSTFIDSTDFDTDGDGRRDFAKVTKIGIKYDNSGVGVDTLGLHLYRGWRLMPYPRGSVDVFEVQLALMDEIHNGRTPSGAGYRGEVLYFQNNSAGTAWIYVWGD